MLELKIYYATVIDNDDTNAPDGEELSRIKVKILPEFKDIKNNAHLPWARPFTVHGMSSNSYSHTPPEIDDKVWVLGNEYLTELYYINGAFIDGFFDASTVETSLGNITEAVTTTYPDLKFYQLADGTILFYNSSSGDVGIYHSTGSYLVIKSTGAFYSYTKAQEAKIYNDNGYLLLNSSGEIHASGSSKSGVTYAELNSAIQTFISALNSHVHTGVEPGAGASGTPTIAMSLNISSAQSDRYKED
jgi:hypothetical protein